MIKNGGSHKKLYEFKWVRGFIKKVIMTISYNSSFRSIKMYICESLSKIEGKYDENCSWYTTLNKNEDNIINDKDISLLVTIIK